MTVRSQVRGTTAVETHGAILDLIRSTGVVSRTELADRSGLTGSSITRIVRQLLDDGLVMETGFGQSTGGKRRTLLQLNPAARTAIGISLDYDQITYIAADLSGTVIARRTGRGTTAKSPSLVTRRIAREVAELVAQAGLDKLLVVGIGVGVAGRRGRTDAGWFNATATEWEHFPLEDILGDATGWPVIVDNDSTCAAIGEYWAGRVPATEQVATVYVTDGFGLGLMVNGEIYRGASGNAGELGHVTIDPRGPVCVCGRRGCLEVMAGAARIVELAHRDEGLVAERRLAGTARTVRSDYAKIARAAAAGDERARRLIAQAANHLASALVSITNVLDLDRIILAGPAFRFVGGIYADAVTERLTAACWARAVHPVAVELSGLGSDVAALGAASLALRTRLTLR